MPGSLQLILPGLFDLPLQELPPGFTRREMPCLNRLLRLADTSANRASNLDQLLRAALNLEAGGVLPLAAAYAETPADQGERLLLVKAIHLRPDLQHALVLPIDENAENLRDIDILIKDLGDLFKVDFDITAVASGLYLMQLKQIDAPRHHPHPLSVLGKAANPYIEQSRQLLPWHRLINEIQMFLHQHEVNRLRTQQGQLAINSLWCWGAGVLPAFNGDLHWYCDDEVLNRFARGLGLNPQPLSDLGDDKASGKCIAIDLSLLQALKSGRDSDLCALLVGIEQSLLKPALDLVTTRRSTLRLRTAYPLDFRLTARSRFRFWRKPRSLEDWMHPDSGS